MRIIEALKTVKMNKAKIEDLKKKIALNCAHLSHETPQYGDQTKEKIAEWLQSITDTAYDNIKLLAQIQKTNLQTLVTIKIGDNTVTRSIAEWIWIRREYAAILQATWSNLTDRKLQEGEIKQSTGQDPIKVTIVRNFDPATRDKMIAMYRDEPTMIDMTLEIVNATTDLVEL